MNLPLQIRSALFTNKGILKKFDRSAWRWRLGVAHVSCESCHSLWRVFKSIPRIPSLIIFRESRVRSCVEKCVQRKKERNAKEGTMSFVSFRMADIMDCRARSTANIVSFLLRPTQQRASKFPRKYTQKRLRRRRRRRSLPPLQAARYSDQLVFPLLFTQLFPHLRNTRKSNKQA